MQGIGPFLRDAWRLAVPYFRSEERWSARLLLAVIVALNLTLVGINVVYNFWNRAFYNALQDKDFGGFINLLLFWRADDKGGFLPGFCMIAALYILVAVYRTYLNQWLQIRWRRWMTERFLNEWLSDQVYYRIGLQAVANGIGTDNPDQRIAEDMRNFIGDSTSGQQGVLQLGLDLLSNVVTLFSFLTILWGLSGSVTLLGLAIPGYMVWVALLYSAAGTWVTHLVGRPLAILNFRQQRVEADFRFALVRIRENVEGIALHGGEREEHRGLAVRFAALIENWWQIMRRTKQLNALVATYTQVASVFPIVVAAPRYFSGAMPLGGLSQTADAFGQVQGAMSWFVSSYASLASWRATTERLASFERAIAAARAMQPELVVTEGPRYGLEHATLALPGGEALVTDATLSVAPGESVVVTGRSGSGKSTLFRALAGIWPFGKGVVHRPPGRPLFLPQRPYIPLGTLRHAVTYPDAPDAHSDAAVREALEAVGLGHLVARLDEDEPWAQRLSGGEQQRLAVARALLVKPDWLFLDEATASLDPQAEGELYALLKARLPKAAMVSIAHRPAVAAHHQRHVEMERGGSGAGVFREA
jgi:putative ATP-binding cassette transporter